MLLSRVNNKVSLDDLLSDMDAQTMVKHRHPDALEDNEHVVHEIARRFHAFLEAGLATGNAPWP